MVLLKVAPAKRLLFCLILLSGCQPSKYFITPNTVHKEKAILFLRDRSKISGEINIYLEDYSNGNIVYQPFIEFIPEGKTQSQVINLTDIAGYSMGADFFALKKIDLNVNNVYYLLFVKRLTGENSKIQLYELYESGRGNPTGESRYTYYLSFPSFDPLQTMNTRSIDLMPSFDQKMSKLVDDCPGLAEKIRVREKGYFLPLVTFANKRHREVLLKIISEYNSCN
jgi:hypothetical protein